MQFFPWISYNHWRSIGGNMNNPKVFQAYKVMEILENEFIDDVTEKLRMCQELGFDLEDVLDIALAIGDK